MEAGPAAVDGGHRGPDLNIAEVVAFTEQARWLLEFHNRRGDGTAQKATALLGFIGVLLALLPGGLTLGKGFHATQEIKACLLVCVASLLVSGGCCLHVLWLRKVAAPEIDGLHAHWKQYTTGQLRGLVHAQIAHDYLGGASEAGPLWTASRDATSKARRLKRALWALLVAVVCLGAMVVQIFIQF